jgi:hypothetical protein
MRLFKKRVPSKEQLYVVVRVDALGDTMAYGPAGKPQRKRWLRNEPRERDASALAVRKF